MDPSSGFRKRPAAVFSKPEMEACRALLQLQFSRKKRTRDWLVKSITFSWRVKGLCTPRYHVLNDGDNEAESMEGTKAPAEVRKNEALVAIRKKIKIIRRPKSERVAMVVMEPEPQPEPVFKAPPLPPQGISTLPFVGSPTSPLLVSSNGDPSDSNYSRGPSPTSPLSSPQDHPLALKLQFKVKTNAEVHISPNSKGDKKKTVAELKQRINEQLMLKEELEKEMKMLVDYLESLMNDNRSLKKQERKMLVNCHESLMDENKRLKEQLALRSERKEEDKLFLCSFNYSHQTILPHSRVEHSSSVRVPLPDFNIPLEES